jgi:hypothetical protein
VGVGWAGEFWILNFEFLIEEGIAHAKAAKDGKVYRGFNF